MGSKLKAGAGKKAQRVAWLVKQRYRDNNAALARAAGVSVTTISRLIREGREPQLATLARIAKGAAVDLDWLRFGKGKPWAAAPPVDLDDVVAEEVDAAEDVELPVAPSAPARIMITAAADLFQRLAATSRLYDIPFDQLVDAVLDQGLPTVLVEGRERLPAAYQNRT